VNIVCHKHSFLPLLCALAFGALPASAQITQGAPVTCSAENDPTQVRTAGVTERLGDIVLNCTGGTPTAAGQPIPLMNVRVSLSVPITSREFADGTSEALLLIDEPFPANPFPSGQFGLIGNSGPQEFCVANGTSNCELTGTGGATNPYQGTFNVFQGVVTELPGVVYIDFLDVPIDPPGANLERIIRITNLRGDATSVSPGYPVTATVSVSGPGSLVIPDPNDPVAFAYSGLQAAPNCTYDPVLHLVSCPGSATQINVGAAEGFASSFKTAVVTSNDQAVGGGLNPVRTMVGGTIETQNIPGLPPSYYTESDLTISSTASSYTGSGIGEASHGTWLMVILTNIPAGVQITAPGSVAGTADSPNLLLYRADVPPSGWQFSPSFYASAPANKVVVDSTVPNPPTTADIVYEVVADDPNLVESFNIPLSVVAQPGVSTSGITTALMFAPVPEAPVATGDESVWQLPSTSLDIPRFLDGVPTLSGPLQIDGIYALGETLTAQFTITNPTAGDFTFQQLLAACDGCPVGYPQFETVSNLTLGPGQSYQYISDALATIPGTFVYLVEYQGTNGVWVPAAPGVTFVTVNVPPMYSLTLNVSGQGSLSANPPPALNGQYASGTYVCLTATPATGWLFGAWSGATLDGSNCLLITSNTGVTAYFVTTTAQFSDVPPTATYFDAADLMFEDGVTTGCVQSNSPQTRQFCPDETVTREEMAAFIVRAVTGTVTPAIYNSTPYFQDVPNTNPFFPHIQKLMDLGITTGCSQSPALFCPTNTIPRWEMAMFLVRARLMLYGASFDYNPTPYFADVPTNVEGNGVPFPFIQRSYDENITNGCGTNPLVYCPDALVTRGQMASFIMRGLFNETMVIGPTAPYLTGVTPNAVSQTSGSQITVTITGANTNFQSGDTVTVPSGMLAVSNVAVNSATSISAALTVNANAVAGPQALVVTTGGQNITLPLAIQVGTY
jgi:hypothetical protein